MSIISGLLNQTIDKIYSVTLDRNSDTVRTQVYSDVRCRWQKKVSRVVGKDAELKRTKIEAWLLPKYDIEEDYNFVKDSKTYRVVAVEDGVDIMGELDHVKVFLE